MISAGTLLGVHYGTCMQKRYDELVEWKKNMIIFRSDISYGGMNILEVMEHVKEQSVTFQSFFQYLIHGVESCQKKKFSELWNEGMDNYLSNSHLNEGDKRELKYMGENLGNVDRNQQLALLQMYLEKWELRIVELEREKEEKKKMYRMVGCLGSIFVALVFL